MAESFADRWHTKEKQLYPRLTPTLVLPCGSNSLPQEAAPFLSFERASDPQPIWEVFGVKSHWKDEDRLRLAKWQMIGSDGAGNPICVEHPNKIVELLDHEDHFKTRQFVNSSVVQLAECLLAYMGEKDPDRFRAAANEIDPLAMQDFSFWSLAAEAIGAYD